MNKVFDFNPGKEPQGIIGRPHELAWPCDMFRVTLPKVKRDEEKEFNAIERCVLKLLLAGRYDAQTLAEETCLPQDLIQAVLLRLQDRAKISEYLEVSTTTRVALEKLEIEDASAPTEYETHVVFRECIGQILLPMLKEAKLKSEEISEEEKGLAIKKSDRRKIGLHVLSAAKACSNVPASKDILAALRTMVRRRKVSGGTERIPPAEFVSVVGEPERCSLRVRMVVQKATGEWRILNPFGKGFSTELEMSYSALCKRDGEAKERLRKWRQQLAASGGQVKGNAENQEPFNTPENRQIYPELIFMLNRRDRGGKEVFDVYAVLEWALFYALHRMEPQSVKNICNRLKLGLAEENAEWVKSVAEKLGLLVDFFPSFIWKDGKTHEFEEGQAEMMTVLPLSILTAENEPSSPFQRLAMYPDFIGKLFEWKKRRDTGMHTKQTDYSAEERSLCKQMVSAVLPDVRFDDTPVPERSDEQIDAIADERFAARVALEFFWGSMFDDFPSDMKNYLLSAEWFRQNHKHDSTVFDALPCINHLYSAVQIAFQAEASKREHQTLAFDDIFPKASAFAGGCLPQSLATVQPDKLKTAISGGKTTLGAIALVWLAGLESDAIARIHNFFPDFLSSLAKLLTLRKHGNQSRPMKSEQLTQLCKATYKLLQTITEN